MIRAGAAAVDITPPVGTALDGYGGRTDVSLGIHDPLFARALYLDDGSAPVALVVCDLVGVGWRLVAEARRLAEARPGIAPGRLLIAATHTHAGPAGVRGAGDPALIETLARAIAGAVQVAARRARPAVLKYGTTMLDSISQNRRDPAWPIDRRLDVLAVDDAEGRNIATAARYSTHATTMDGSNLEISADYPGAACRVMEGVIGRGSVGLFFNGCCANINPAWVRQEFDEVDRIGSVVGARAAALSQELRPLGPGLRAHNIRWDELTPMPVTSGVLPGEEPFRAGSVTVRMPFRSGPSDTEMVELIAMHERAREAAATTEERREAAARLTRARMERLSLARIAGRGPTRDEPIQALRLGRDLVVLALPGEVFVETQEEIRHRSGLENLVVIGYANSYPGYFCPAEAYEQGGYEAGVTPFAPEAEALLVDGALRALREVV